MADMKDIDQLSGVDTTGHSWDGIKELNNPLPRWWLWTLYGTIIWSVGYVIVYPAFPGLTGNSKGMWNWSSRADVQQEMQVAVEGRKGLEDKLATMDINTIMGDEAARTFAVSAGGSIFKVNCVQCHGSGAQGGPGFPNLNDNSWIWGGKPEQIVQTIAHGVRQDGNDNTRANIMPAFGKDGLLEPAKIEEVTNTVLQLSGQEHDAALATAGAVTFAEQCAACHGEKGEGLPELGGPQLNDAVWLYGGDKAAITAQINNPKLGMMPSWQDKLGETKVKQLAAYVLSLGGGQK